SSAHPAPGAATSAFSTMTYEEEENYESNFSQKEFEKIVETLKHRVTRGDFLQAVPSRIEKKKTRADAWMIFHALNKISPTTQYRYLLKMDDFFIVGASPELQVSVDFSGQITTHPIAGTRPRSKFFDDKEDVETAIGLLHDEKELAEHVMLVDLARNDIGKIAKPGSVECVEFQKIKFFPNVMHLCSKVVGQIHAGGPAGSSGIKDSAHLQRQARFVADTSSAAG
ncbi:unnamed protein product, partial [Amoebophrya sp. A120]